MTTVALFGGSFDPPHVAHQMVCLYALATQPVDTLWMMPTYRHPFCKSLAPFDDRLAMCRLAAEPFGGRVVVRALERELASDTGYTLDLVRALREREPDRALRLVVGGDILAEVHQWHRWEELERLAPPLVVGRVGSGQAGPVALPNVSSTEVRRRIAAGESVSALVPRPVIDYIHARGLYR